MAVNHNWHVVAEQILEEFVEDVQAADAEKVKKEWPDLHHTYKKACRALDVEEDD
jgi:hypothetical protein